ncbi:response regulator transcription factor [Granulicella tundricola]|uniref:Two component transcriptional regulator, winged helix family n=1 Tax=Granulicella tundricola (strain ATCC BAA-1859 / DSM 23138 / MP5ACTX9) TaxID=1198114 RepID=E8X6N5_GRATM|nr:response regulator transcription factor [Granulicella tundricola]ADW71185.1 two component transcriptional regulator, winged helix family [Granulicella tundricola MP5ACTX9]
MRVLIVEDELRLAENVAEALRQGPGFAVDHAEDGEAAIHLAANACYDLIILDLNLPKMDGPAVLHRLRATGDKTPTLILTARAERESIVALLNAGADDYLTKPFDLGELIARAKALIRRSTGVAAPSIRLGELEVDTLQQTVSRAGTLIPLSPMEYRILEYLIHRPRIIVSKRQLLEHMYDFNWEHHSNVIEAHLSNLRRKLDPSGSEPVIETLRGRGYRLLAGPQGIR